MKADGENVSTRYFLIFVMLAGVGWNGSCTGIAEVSERVGHPHGASDSVVSHDVEGCGNCSWTILRSFMAVCDKYKPLQFLEMYTICRDCLLLNQSSTNITPAMSKGDFVIPIMRCCVDIR